MLYRKNLTGFVLKNEKPTRAEVTPPPFSELFSGCAEAKIRYLFAQSGVQLSLALREQPENARQLAAQQVEYLFDVCKKPYVAYCVCAMFTGATGFAFAKKKSAQDGLVKRFADILADCVARYEQRKETFLLRLLDTVLVADDLSTEQLQTMLRLFETESGGLLDRGYRVKLQSRLAGMENAGLKEYRYRSESGEKTCKACAALDGKTFAIADAEEGVNFPLLHPNCRCWIEAPAAADVPQESDIRLLKEDVLSLLFQRAGEAVALAPAFAAMLEDALAPKLAPAAQLGVAAVAAWEAWKAILAENMESFFAGYDTVTVNGKEYRINRKTFTAVAADENGNLLVPENAKPYDETLLKLMRQRDALPPDDPQRQEIEAQIKEIADKKGNLISVNPEKPFRFYVADTDVTEKLDTFMAQAEQTYAHMHERSFPQNIEEFISLVDSNKTMDLKSQQDWEKPVYIYHGEIIQREDTGNINYGYFGTFCNFPQIVLLFGAGTKQLLSKTSDITYWVTLFDDPRDTIRILQGIQLYNHTH